MAVISLGNLFTAVAVFCALITTINATNCYNTTDPNNSNDRGKKIDCGSYTYCTKMTSPSLGTVRTCGLVSDAFCNAVGDGNCGAPPTNLANLPVTSEAGANLCCCKSDYCNVSASLSHNTVLISVCLLSLASFIMSKLF
uniref:Activin types I and II receptor domain-containing protein n=1 Tax=Plectus sambesii TaxID=2011161 RepID=A0A914XF33_9BILA